MLWSNLSVRIDEDELAFVVLGGVHGSARNKSRTALESAYLQIPARSQGEHEAEQEQAFCRRHPAHVIWDCSKMLQHCIQPQRLALQIDLRS